MTLLPRSNQWMDSMSYLKASVPTFQLSALLRNCSGCLNIHFFFSSLLNQSLLNKDILTPFKDR